MRKTATTASLPSTADPWPESRDRRVVLLIPDRFTRALYRQHLEEAGYSVVEAESPSAVLVPNDRTPADLIVLDASVRQAEMIGIAERLNGNPMTRDIPVLALVADGDDPRKPHSLDAADDCLVKPARQWELLMRVRSLLRLGEHRKELLNSRSLHGEQTRTWEVLLEFTRSVTRARDLNTLLEDIVHAATVMTSSRRVSLMLPDTEEKHLTIAKSVGLDPEYAAGARVPIGEAISGRAFRSGRPVTSLDDHEELARRKGFGFQSFVSMPMIYMGMNLEHQRVGVLNISNRYGDRPFEEWELEFIDLLGSIAGSAIDEIHSQQTRESLLQMERDLMVARKIQQSTFPKRLPALHGFEIDAWSEPAEQTAGDSYDVIGYLADPAGGVLRFSEDIADRAILLLADATGHGIGPALSVTQVRSMLRMALRMQVDLTTIAAHMNQQLFADLPGGRFVTAWLGDLDARDGMLTSLSAGQAPILHYHADRDDFEVLAADTMPLGIQATLDIPARQPIRMAPGDIVAILSDGLIEAADAERRLFGIDRTKEVIAANADRNPTRIRTALRRAVTELTGPVPPADDRTAIIIKRSVSRRSAAA